MSQQHTHTHTETKCVSLCSLTEVVFSRRSTWPCLMQRDVKRGGAVHVAETGYAHRQTDAHTDTHTHTHTHTHRDTGNAFLIWL